MKKLVAKARGAMVLVLAASGLVLGLGVAVPGAASAQTPPPPPPPVQGNSHHVQMPPNHMSRAIDFWHDMHWPNWRNIGDREWFEGNRYQDPRTGRDVHELVYTGGRYYDRDGRLMAFMNNGQGPSSSYAGTFQEYNTTIYNQPVDDSVPRRNVYRIVRAIGTGDMFWTDDHYASFHYMGRG